MATINYAAREINVKIVYYGPALSGKTTNLQIIHQKSPQEAKSDMVSLATESDRTLFFDFLPIDLGKIKGFTTKIQLYTVPGQVYYNATRKLVLRGVDGIVFVADSSADKLTENIESLDNMEENLAEYGYALKSIPVVLQFNKRDCENPLSPEELERKLNRYNSKCVNAIAMTGEGVFDTLKVISKEVIDVLNKKYESAANAVAGEAAKPAPQPVQSIQPAQPVEAQKPIEPKPIEPIQTKIPEPVVKPVVEPKLPEEVLQTNNEFLDLDLSAPMTVEPKIQMPTATVTASYEEIVLEDAADNNYHRHIAEKEKKAEETIKGFTSEINLEEMFGEQIEEAFEDDFGAVSLNNPVPPVVKSNGENLQASMPENPFLEDVLDDVPAAPVVVEKIAEHNPIRAAFENKYSDGWIPPETVLFTSFDNDPRKSERILAAKKKPVNPKYKKSFLDNLFKKQPLD